MPPGDEVLVYREIRDMGGPYVLYKYDNYKTAYVDINGSIKPFSTASVKPYLREPQDTANVQESQPDSSAFQDATVASAFIR